MAIRKEQKPLCSHLKFPLRIRINSLRNSMQAARALFRLPPSWIFAEAEAEAEREVGGRDL
jgi:hypothetical protein